MVFTAEYEYALRAVVFGITIGAWIIARAAFGQPVAHPWFGALLAGLVGSIGTTLAVLPGIGPLPTIVSMIGALFAGLLFTAGVRCEALGTPLRATGTIGLLIAAIIGGLALEFGISDPPVRVALRQACVGLPMAAAIFWVPRLWREQSPKIGALLLGVASLGLGFDRAVPLVHMLATHDARGLVFPYLRGSDIFAIIGAGAIMIVYSAERAFRTRRQAQEKLWPALDKESSQESL